MPIPEAYPVQEFLNYLAFQRRYSRHTIISYENDLRGFFEYVGSAYNSPALPEISPAVIRSWLATLKGDKVASRTLNRKISTLKSFFKYQLKMNSLEVNPMSTVTSLKTSRRLPSFIGQRDIHTLFNSIEFPDTWEGRTSRLLLMIFYHTGIRLSELMNLREIHIDKRNSNIKVLGKGNKERLIPVNNELLHQVEAYISDKKILATNNTDGYLFVNRNGKKLYAKYVYNTVKQYLGDVSTHERKSPHVLRHSFATHLTNNGADINAVKELLGHSSLASTQVYTHNSIDKLKQVHKLAHPKA